MQIRDENMTLRAYFRLSQTEIGLIKNNLEEDAKAISNLLKEIPFGKIQKYISKHE